MSKIEIRALSHQFVDGRGRTVEALQDINLTVGEGKFVTIVGPSGCGKTTLLNIVAGFIAPTTGDVLLDGKAVRGPGPDRGVVFQGFALFDWLTVRRNIEFGLRMRGVPADERAAKVDQYLGLIGLRKFGDRYPYELSGGMKQRVAIARVLANEPNILLMDEPFAALDAQTREIMQEELLRIWETTGKTVIFITHSIDEAVYLSTDVAVMTFRPGQLKQRFAIDLPYPRNDYNIRADHRFLEFRLAIHELVSAEIKKHALEEL